MSELSSPHMQRIIRSVHRLNISLYAVMLLIMLSGVGLSVLMATRFGDYYGGFDWAQICYIVMLSATLLYSVVVLVLNLLTRTPYRNALCDFVAGKFCESDVLYGGKNVEISIYLIGDRLCVAKQGEERLIYFDLEPVKKYYSVCSYASYLVKKYLIAYYSLNAQKDGYYSVAITDATGSKPKTAFAVKGGLPVRECDNNPFVKRGYLSAQGDKSAVGANDGANDGAKDGAKDIDAGA